MSERDRERSHEEGVGLLRGYANRDLTDAERRRLASLCAEDPELRRSSRGLEELHEVFTLERELRQETSAPLGLDEQGDEGFQRLARVAAAAEDGLRARLRHGRDLAEPGVSEVRAAARETVQGLGGRRLLLAAALLLLAGVAVVVLLRDGDRAGPGLLPGRPQDLPLGGGEIRGIVMSTELHLDRPVLEWHAVVGASGYRVVLDDAEGEPVLQRPVSAATTWQLDAAEVEVLRRRGDEGLRLRVVAVDRDGIPVGTTGDLPLRIRED